MIRNATTTTAGARTQNIINPEAKFRGYGLSDGIHVSDLYLGWEDPAGMRYHIWLNPENPEEFASGGVHDGKTLFKNPPLDLKSGDPGYFQTRHLNATSKTNAATIEKVRAMVDIPAARSEFERGILAEREAQAAAQKEQARKKAMESAAEDLYEAAKRFLAADEAYHSIDGPGGDKLDELGLSKELLRAAVTKAERIAD
jgi:hypothetical protein